MNHTIYSICTQLLSAFLRGFCYSGAYIEGLFESSNLKGKEREGRIIDKIPLLPCWDIKIEGKGF